MKLSAISFNESDEPLLAKVVCHLRDQGTLGRIQKLALINEAALEAVFRDPRSTHEERVNAIALTQSAITARQSLLDLYRQGMGMPKAEAVAVAAIALHQDPTLPVEPSVDDDDDDVSGLDNY